MIFIPGAGLLIEHAWPSTWADKEVHFQRSFPLLKTYSLDLWNILVSGCKTFLDCCTVPSMSFLCLLIPYSMYVHMRARTHTHILICSDLLSLPSSNVKKAFQTSSMSYDCQLGNHWSGLRFHVLVKETVSNPGTDIELLALINIFEVLKGAVIVCYGLCQ